MSLAWVLFRTAVERIDPLKGGEGLIVGSLRWSRKGATHEERGLSSGSSRMSSEDGEGWEQSIGLSQEGSLRIASQHCRLIGTLVSGGAFHSIRSRLLRSPDRWLVMVDNLQSFP